MRGSVLAAVALTLCVLGCALLFLPWAETMTLWVEPTPQPDGTYKALRLPSHELVPGYRFWHASAAAGGFLALLLFLFATGRVRPMPWWRPTVVLAVAVGVLVTVLVGMSAHH